MRGNTNLVARACLIWASGAGASETAMKGRCLAQLCASVVALWMLAPGSQFLALAHWIRMLCAQVPSQPAAPQASPRWVTKRQAGRRAAPLFSHLFHTCLPATILSQATCFILAFVQPGMGMGVGVGVGALGVYR